MTAATGLEQVNYPWPLFIKNTFLNGNVPRSQSFEEYFEERGMCSCPASMVDAAAEPACDYGEKVTSTMPRCAPATDLFAYPAALQLTARRLQTKRGTASTMK